VFVVLRGVAGELTVAAVFAVIALACGAVLAALLRHVQPRWNE
jgi:hypothetical protein